MSFSPAALEYPHNMSSSDISLTTSEAHEYNPKAVFFGQNDRLINPLALYLSERSVDLYSGKTLSDAFFGDYFIYVGKSDAVKDFIAGEKQPLPKTLLLLTDVSDVVKMQEELKTYPQIKLVDLNGATEIMPEDTGMIIEFFLGQEGQMLTLKRTGAVVAATQLKQRRDRESQAEQKKSETQPGSEEKIEPVSVEGQLPQKSEPARADETAQTIQTLYDNGSPKPTGRMKSNLPQIRLSVFMSAFLVLVVLVVFPLLTLVAEVTLAGTAVFLAKRSLEEQKLGSARAHVQRAERLVGWGGQQVAVLLPVAEMLKQRELGNEFNQLFSASSHALTGAARLLEVGERGELLLSGISGKNKGVAHNALIADIKGTLAVADIELGLAEAEVKTASLQHFFSRSGISTFKGQFTDAGQKLSQLRQEIATLKGAMQLLPEVVGLNSGRTFLIVFQNNMELRPTGGFIGSFGLMTFADGVLRDFTVEDVYAADGGLRGHIDPPPPIRDILGAEHWYLRDANWDPDFGKTGAQLKWFLEKELDVAVDGVIGVDVTFVEKLLQVTGPLTLPDSKVTISAENLYTRLQSEVHEDFFPGSTRKRDTLAELGRALTLKLVEGEGISWPALLSQLDNSFNERHLLVYFAKAEIEALAAELGWTGTAGKLPACATVSCISDYQFVVDANLGVNKTNFFVKREVAEKVVIDEDKLTHTLNLTYANGATNNAGFGGTYKNYARVFVPAGNELISATINSQSLTIIAGPVASSSAVAVGEENGLPVFAALVEVLPQEEKTLTLTYSRPLQISGEFPLEYLYAVQKQAGTPADTYSLEIGYPGTWKPLETSATGQVAGATTLVKEGKITYNSTLSQDQKLELTFIK